MLKRLMSLGAAALAAATAACGDGPATLAGGWRSPATWSSMVHATSRGPMLVQVHGAPFGLTRAQAGAVVAAAMTDRVFGRPTAFTADPALAPVPAFRVVLAFNPPADTAPDRLCRGPVATLAGASDRLTVLAAFCQEETLLASIRGWVDGVREPGDKRFALLMGQLTRELFGNPP